MEVHRVEHATEARRPQGGASARVRVPEGEVQVACPIAELAARDRAVDGVAHGWAVREVRLLEEVSPGAVPVDGVRAVERPLPDQGVPTVPITTSSARTATRMAMRGRRAASRAASRLDSRARRVPEGAAEAGGAYQRSLRAAGASPIPSAAWPRCVRPATTSTPTPAISTGTPSSTSGGPSTRCSGRAIGWGGTRVRSRNRPVHDPHARRGVRRDVDRPVPAVARAGGRGGPGAGLEGRHTAIEGDFVEEAGRLERRFDAVAFIKGAASLPRRRLHRGGHR